MNKFLTLYNRLFVVWVILGGLAAFYFPGVFIPMKGYMELFFGLTMFGVGMTLNPADFINIGLFMAEIQIRTKTEDDKT